MRIDQECIHARRSQNLAPLGGKRALHWVNLGDSFRSGKLMVKFGPSFFIAMMKHQIFIFFDQINLTDSDRFAVPQSSSQPVLVSNMVAGFFQ